MRQPFRELLKMDFRSSLSTSAFYRDNLKVISDAGIERTADRAGGTAEVTGVTTVIGHWRIRIEQVGNTGDDDEILEALVGRRQVDG